MPNYTSVVTLCDSIKIQNKTIWLDYRRTIRTRWKWIGCMPNYTSVVTLCDSIKIRNKTIWLDYRQTTRTRWKWIGCMPNYTSVVTLRDSINILNETIVKNVNKTDKKSLWQQNEVETSARNDLNIRKYVSLCDSINIWKNDILLQIW